MIRLDLRCDVCDESARYVKPPVEVSLEAIVCEGRGGTPPEVFDTLPELFRLIMRGLVETVAPGQRTQFVNVLRLCGSCAPLLGSADGQATIVDAIRERVRPLPAIAPGDLVPPGVPPVPAVPPAPGLMLELPPAADSAPGV